MASLPDIALRTVAVACVALVIAACGSGGYDAPHSVRPQPSARGMLLGALTSGTTDGTGGTLVSPDGRITIVIPPGAVSEPTTFTIAEITNTAPGSHGVAYRLGPEHTVFAVPVTLTFKPDLTSTTLDLLGIATQDAVGYWLRIRNVTRDAVAGTLSAPTSHFSDWSVVTRSTRDLQGPFTLVASGPFSFTANGLSTLNFSGEDTAGAYYLHWGSITLPDSVTSGTATCSSGTPKYELPTNVADVTKSWTRFGWGLSAHWSLTCNDPYAGLYDDFLSTLFDTWGINHLGCTRGYTATPVITAERIAGTYQIDCGVNGALTASWDFDACTEGVSCPSGDPCRLATISCDTGDAVCTDAGPAPNGTTCGTDLVCKDGLCVSCTGGLACTLSTNPCHVGTTSCDTGEQVCQDTGVAVADGTSCGTDAVCHQGTCSACIEGLSCTPETNPCHVGTTTCDTGTQVCTDTGVNVADGTSCGTDAVCGGGVCNSCVEGAACVSPNPCTTASIVCSSGHPVCTEGAPLADGTVCGTDMVCTSGVCTSCVEGVACTPTNACHVGTTSCSSGPTCLDTGTNVANGTTCGTDAVCSEGTCGTCVEGAACDPADPCKTGTTSCSTGLQVCTDSGNEPDGTVCGTDLVCSGGVCTSCVEGLACTPENPCHVGTTTCDTGTQVCTDTGTNAIDGTSCGVNGEVCVSGTCALP